MLEKEPSSLLLLPGLDGTDVFFRPLLAALPDSIRPRVLCYPDGAGNSYDGLLPFVRRAVADDTKLFVLGSSFGGPLAAMLAAEEPERVRGLILVASFLRAPRRRLALLRFAIVPPVMWLWRTGRRVPGWMSKDRSDPFRRARAETWSRVSTGSITDRARAALSVDARAIYRACPQSALCIAFERDGLISKSRTEDFLAREAPTRLVHLPGDHLAMYRDPLPLRDEIVRFIHGHGRP